VLVEFEVREATERGVQARVRGARVREAPATVKAATLHGLRLEKTAEGLEAEITLDV
jgi:SHS2 domain-containing protein